MEKNAPVTIPDFSKTVVPESERVIELKQQIQNDDRALLANSSANSGGDYVTKGIVFTLLSLILLIVVYLIYNYAQFFIDSGVSATEQNLVFENQLVRADKSRVISLEAGATREQVRTLILQALLNEKVLGGEVSLIMPSYLRDTTINGERKLISELQRGDDFFFTFAPRAPLNLRTIAAQNYAIGVVGSGSSETPETKNFLTFSVSSAPDATREMLRYEAEMYNDMRETLKLRDIKGNFYFKDQSDNNHILRVAYDDNGVVLVYGYGAPRTVIIAPDTLTFQTVYSHLK